MGTASARMLQPSRSASNVNASAALLYLELLKKTLTRSLFDEMLAPVAPAGRLKRSLVRPLEVFLRRRGAILARPIDLRQAFSESPPRQIRTAETLTGPVGLENVQSLVETVLLEDVPGDLIETGVWRGGTVIFMRGVLAAYHDESRSVWAADSFAGLPSRGSTKYAQDDVDRDWSAESWMSVPLDEVRRNFERYGLLDERVRFLVGWFDETLADGRIERLALMRLDGDMYGSTMDALQLLYPKLSVGGYVVVDDYWLPNCGAAVEDFRSEHCIEDEMVYVDRAIAYWRRSR